MAELGDEELEETSPEGTEPKEAVVDGPVDTEAADVSRPNNRIVRTWRWLRAKPARMLGLGVAAVLIIGGGVLGATDLKYPVIGTFMTGSLDVVVSDEVTKQPVPKALVTFGGSSDLTDKNGRVSLAKVQLGHGQLKVSKAGYTDFGMSELAGLRKGPSVDVKLKPNGIKVVAQVTNLITGGSVEGAEVRAGDASAISDKTGRAEISLPPAANNTKQTLTFSRDGYNGVDVDVQVKVGGQPVAAALVPSGKVYFQSNRTGRIDIYSSNLDGSGAEIVLAGTGSEDSATGILPNIDDPHTLAIVSSRDGRRGGTLHHDLFIFNTESRKISKIESDVEFTNFRAWVGSTLVYEKTLITPQAYCNNIKTYEVASGKTGTIFAAQPSVTGCATVTLALNNGFIFSVRNADETHAGIFSAKITGAPKRISQTYSDNTVRRAKQTLLSEYYNFAGQTWDSIDLGSFAVAHLANGPSIETSRYYNDSPNNSLSVFIEERDGKSELYLTDGNGGNEKKLTNIGSANQFVQWYGNDYIVFSSTRTEENALYVIAVNGGKPVKVADFYRGNQRTYGGGGNPYN